MLLCSPAVVFSQQRWERNYGGANFDYGYSVQQTLDGGYIVAGYSDCYGNGTQVYLVKTNASGDTLWTRAYGGYLDDWGFSVKQTIDTGYIVAGYTTSFGNGWQVYLIKTNSSGDTLWTKGYGGSGDENGYSVQQTLDGGYIVAGLTTSFGNSAQVYLIKTDASGDTLWTRTYGDTLEDVGYSVQQTSDGGYIVVGYTYSFGNLDQVYLIKTDASGDTLWTRTYGGITNDRGYYIEQTPDEGYIIAGYTNSFGNRDQVYLIKTDVNGNVGVETNQEFEGPRVQGFKVTSNPFTSFAALPGHEADRFSLYDISGRKVGVYRGDRIGWDVSPGVYFLRSDNRPPAPDARVLRIVKLR